MLSMEITVALQGANAKGAVKLAANVWSHATYEVLKMYSRKSAALLTPLSQQKGSLTTHEYQRRDQRTVELLGRQKM